MGTTPPARRATPESLPRQAEPAVQERGSGAWILIVLLAILTIFRVPARALLGGPAVQTWITIVLSITLQAVPFLVLGVLLGACIEAFVPVRRISRPWRARAWVTVPLAGLAGATLPGCECSSVLVARRLAGNRLPPGAALAFLLSAPSINPVVLVATAVAFPGHPMVVLARLAASLATALIVGLAWTRFGIPLRGAGTAIAHDSSGRWSRFRSSFVDDFVQAGGFLMVGAAATGTLQVLVPARALDSLASSGLRAALVLGLLAVALCVCSEADAFVAASLAPFSMTARLAFMVVGPVVDLKLISLEAGVFGIRFVAAFVPLVFSVALACSLAAGVLLR